MHMLCFVIWQCSSSQNCLVPILFLCLPVSLMWFPFHNAIWFAKILCLWKGIQTIVSCTAVILTAPICTSDPLTSPVILLPWPHYTMATFPLPLPSDFHWSPGNVNSDSTHFLLQNPFGDWSTLPGCALHVQSDPPLLLFLGPATDKPFFVAPQMNEQTCLTPGLLSNCTLWCSKCRANHPSGWQSAVILSAPVHTQDLLGALVLLPQPCHGAWKSTSNRKQIWEASRRLNHATQKAKFRFWPIQKNHQFHCCIPLWLSAKLTIWCLEWNWGD